MWFRGIEVGALGAEIVETTFVCRLCIAYVTPPPPLRRVCHQGYFCLETFTHLLRIKNCFNENGKSFTLERSASLASSASCVLA